MNSHFPKIRIQTQVSVAGAFPRLVHGFRFPKKAKISSVQKESVNVLKKYLCASNAFEQLLKWSKTP